MTMLVTQPIRAQRVAFVLTFALIGPAAGCGDDSGTEDQPPGSGGAAAQRGGASGQSSAGRSQGGGGSTHAGASGLAGGAPAGGTRATAGSSGHASGAGSPASGGIDGGEGGTPAAGGARAGGGTPAAGRASAGAGSPASAGNATTATGATPARGGGGTAGGSATGGSGGTATGGTSVTGGTGNGGNADANVVIDRGTQYQTIEGFGFFGAADVWWSSSSAVLDEAWTAKVIDDLGISMWRNEYYAAGTPQDADWDKQLPVVQSLANYASQKRVPLKMILTVWSPPASTKCLSDDDLTCNSNPPTRPADTKGGNILDPAERASLADWLIQGVELYRDAGVELYGLSFQNEPYFSEPYNSCFYAQDSYVATLAAVGQELKAAYPNLKLFGAENMLGIECGRGSEGTQFDPYWYTANIMEDTTALSVLDAWAVHGYVDGVSATATSKLATLWTSFRDGTASTGKSIWMTETSGYFHTWPGSTSSPGGLDLAQAIYASLYYGHLSAWTYWQGSEKSGFTEYSLMAGANDPGKNYYVSKQFFRYIRPGARMVQVTTSDPSLFAVAFSHTEMGAFTVVVINVATQNRTLTLGGADLPSTFEAYRTSASENCVSVGSVGSSLILPPSSVTTLVNGNVYE